MIVPKLENVRTVLALGAHPDDIEIGCGGSLLRLTAEHTLDLHWVVLSGGETRMREAHLGAEAFAKRARSCQVTVLDFPDAYFPGAFGEIKTLFDKLGREISPDLIFTHRREDRHQDHRQIAELTWNTFRDHFILEYEIPKYEGDLGRPNLYIPLSQETCEEKIQTLMDVFVSQRSRRWFTEDAFWALLRLRGLESGSGGHHAEAFEARKILL